MSQTAHSCELRKSYFGFLFSFYLSSQCIQIPLILFDYVPRNISETNLLQFLHVFTNSLKFENIHRDKPRYWYICSIEKTNYKALQKSFMTKIRNLTNLGNINSSLMNSLQKSTLTKKINDLRNWTACVKDYKELNWSRFLYGLNFVKFKLLHLNLD